MVIISCCVFLMLFPLLAISDQKNEVNSSADLSGEATEVEKTVLQQEDEVAKLKERLAQASRHEQLN